MVCNLHSSHLSLSPTVYPLSSGQTMRAGWLDHGPASDHRVSPYLLWYHEETLFFVHAVLLFWRVLRYGAFFGYQYEKNRVPISSFQIIFVNFKGAHSQGWHTDRQWALVYSKELMQLCRTCSFEKFEKNYLIVAVATGVSPSTLLEKNPKKLSQHKFIGGEEWKSYINNIWLNSNPSTNIHWSVNFRRFFVNVFLLLKIWFESMHFL